METDNMRESIQTGSRDVSIDIAKGILAICVIFGHVVLSGIGHDLVYAFHVPAFFIITGMMVRITDESVRGMPEILKKNILAILIPYTFFELLGGISYYIRCGFGQSVVGLIYNAVTMNCNNGPDWFLYTLFFAKVLFVLCMKCVGERKQWRNVYVAFSVVMMVAATVFCYETWVYMIIRHVVLAHGFITIGFVLCEAFRKEYLKAAIVALLAVVFISYFDISPDFHQMQFGNIYLYFISSIFGTYALLLFMVN